MSKSRLVSPFCTLLRLITCKLWDCSEVIPKKIHEFETCCGAIYAILAQEATIYAGCQDGHVKVIDPETKTIIRTIIVQEVEPILFRHINSLFLGRRHPCHVFD